jgi:hypothetical protein
MCATCWLHLGTGKKSRVKRVTVPEFASLDSNDVRAANLRVYNPRVAQASPNGTVLCAVCGGATKQAPILLGTPETKLVYAVPVLCTDCSGGN